MSACTPVEIIEDETKALHRKAFNAAAFGTTSNNNNQPSNNSSSSSTTEMLSDNSKILPMEEYQRYIFVIQHWDKGDGKLCKEDFRRLHKEKGGYRIVANYTVKDVKQSNGTSKLRLLRMGKQAGAAALLAVPEEEIFDIIYDVHVPNGHTRKDTTFNLLKNSYYSITRDLCKIFVSTCPTCCSSSNQSKSTSHNKKKKLEGGASSSSPLSLGRGFSSASTATTVSTETMDKRESILSQTKSFEIIDANKNNGNHNGIGELKLNEVPLNTVVEACNGIEKLDEENQNHSVELRNNQESATEHDISGSTYKVDNTNKSNNTIVGKLEELKQREAKLSQMLADIRREKLSVIQSQPLTIGLIGFGRFGQFIAETFVKYGRVVATSRSDYTDIANKMGVTYVPLSDMGSFLAQGLDVIVVAVSIMSFEKTLKDFLPHLEQDIASRRAAISNNGKTTTSLIKGPLIVDVLSVKEHAREVMLNVLPPECDILCTHPMFGPDSGKDGWNNLNFVYEKTRIDSVVLDPSSSDNTNAATGGKEVFVDNTGHVHSIHEDSEAHIEGMDRIERFLSIWEEEGCRMVPMSCKQHDAFTANSQFITHLMGRILGSQGLSNTPIDTKSFESVLDLIKGTTADSFDLFYGLYKYNQNSSNTILQLQSAMDDVVKKLQDMEHEEKKKNDYPPNQNNETKSNGNDEDEDDENTRKRKRDIKEEQQVAV